MASKAYIPLVGAQMAYAGTNYSLLFRVVGFPALIGHVRYAESFQGAASLDASGNYKGTNFVEVLQRIRSSHQRTREHGAIR